MYLEYINIAYFYILMEYQTHLLNVLYKCKMVKVTAFPLLMAWFTPWPRTQVSSFSTSHHKPFSHSSQTLAYCRYSKTPESSLSSCSYSCWDSVLQTQTSETEAYCQRSQMYPHRKYSEPPVYQSSQALSFPQHEVYETTASFSHGNKHPRPLQIPKRLSDQATFWRQ